MAQVKLDDNDDRLMTRMCELLNTFCEINGLPKQSADELYLHVLDEFEETDPKRESLAEWLRCYVDMWTASNF